MEKQGEENKIFGNRQLLKNVVVAPQPVSFRVKNIKKEFYKFTQNKWNVKSAIVKSDIS